MNENRSARERLVSVVLESFGLAGFERAWRKLAVADTRSAEMRSSRARRELVKLERTFWALA